MVERMIERMVEHHPDPTVQKACTGHPVVCAERHVDNRAAILHTVGVSLDDYLRTLASLIYAFADRTEYSDRIDIRQWFVSFVMVDVFRDVDEISDPSLYDALRSPEEWADLVGTSHMDLSVEWNRFVSTQRPGRLSVA